MDHQSTLEYTIDKEQGISFQKFSGFIRFEDLVEFNKRKIQDPNFREGLHILVDLSESEIGLTDKEIERYTRYLIDKKEKYEGTRCAIISDNPKQFVKSFFFKEYASVFGKVEIFSTREAALRWLNS